VDLDLTSFAKALATLDRAIRRSRSEPEDEEVRDSVIQRFEYTYELAWKMLKRRLELDSPSPQSVDALSFRDLIREGAERGLVDTPQAWFGYREMRNITSHTYNEEKARQVYEAALRFYDDASLLHDRLSLKNVSDAPGSG
jgi:nucleotidyltransferase substrate binding protein (TIGR01987 family)